MRDTVHGTKRRSQRGFTAEIIELIRDFGCYDGDRQTLDRRDAAALVSAFDCAIKKALRARSQAIRLLDKGGGTAVFSEDDQLITVFNPNTYRRPKRGSRRPRRQLKVV
jgi:hypothetical protein